MKILKYISMIAVFCIAILLFLPKQNIYFAIEKELKKYDIIISGEKFTSHLLGFNLENAVLYVQDVNIAKLNKVNISLSGIDISSKEIGYAYTFIDIGTKSFIVNFEPTKTFIKKYKIVLKYFKKQKNGVYKYEYKLL